MYYADNFLSNFSMINEWRGELPSFLDRLDSVGMGEKVGISVAIADNGFHFCLIQCQNTWRGWIVADLELNKCENDPFLETD